MFLNVDASGAWYDRINGATPVALNNVLGLGKMSVFQADINVTATSIQSEALDQIIQQVQDTKSDALLYITIYTFDNISTLTDKTWDLLAEPLKKVRKTGRRVILRAFSEMNGAWFSYGQRPSIFSNVWRAMVTRIRSKVDGIAFCWAPNSGNAYPFTNMEFSVKNNTIDWKLLDTNKDGKLDLKDDPYTPFYPGDEYVDWVGFSIYHYGHEWVSGSGFAEGGWQTNDVPSPGKVEAILTGKFGQSGPFDFYKMFSVDHQKPFMATETSSTVHVEYRNNGTKIDHGRGSLAIKQTWWRQLYNTTFLQKYPKIKLICSFEFVKNEEITLRDFQLIKDGDLVAALRSDLKALPAGTLIFANDSITAATSDDTSSKSGSSSILHACNWFIIIFMLIIFINN